MEGKIRGDWESAENAIEWLRGENIIHVTLSQKRLINKVLALKKKFPDDVEITRMPEENDGYLLCRLPLSWLNISHREMSEEWKEAAAERLREMRNRKEKKKEKGES